MTYLVSNQITATLKELSGIGEQPQADSLIFSATDTREARKKALQLVYEDAHDKAQ